MFHVKRGIILNIEFMKIAIKEAQKAYNNDDVPVGAVIVKDNIIISKAHNKKTKTGLPTSHAEIIAIEKACKKMKDWRLNECIMYVTLEPCKMCMGAISESRLEKVYYGTSSHNLEKHTHCEKVHVSDKEINQECKETIEMFFKTKRK